MCKYIVPFLDGSANWCNMGVSRHVFSDVAALRTSQWFLLLSLPGLYAHYILGVQGDRVRETCILYHAHNYNSRSFHVNNKSDIFDRYPWRTAVRPLLLDSERENFLDPRFRVVPSAFPPSPPLIPVLVRQMPGTYQYLGHQWQPVERGLRVAGTWEALEGRKNSRWWVALI